MFVTLEGPEGAGKSTVMRGLASRISEGGREVVETREPGAGEFGSAVRDLLLHGEDIDPKTELFLYLADRAEHVAKIVRPALERGAVVLCDRHADSTVVYQGYGRGLDLGLLRDLNAMATGGLKPDLTLLLDIDPAVGLSRTTKGDRLDREPLEFHQKVRGGFLDEAKREPDRWVVIDASRSAEAVLDACWLAASARL
ncbi:MAG TPA: dTMP kinase [Fimbriimonadaceae bacterium]|nr:dTMP kinase [Fimbriimonadaceae bacterium]